MKIDKTRLSILELCSESEYGSWEFWSNKDAKTESERDHIVQTIVNLVREKKIFPVEYKSISDQTYREVPLNVDRLRKEITQSMVPNNVDPHGFYWFLATEEGKEEDLEGRRSQYEKNEPGSDPIM